MTVLVLLLAAVVAAAAIACGVVRMRPSDRTRAVSWGSALSRGCTVAWGGATSLGRAVRARLPHRVPARRAPQRSGRHRFEDAPAGSLPATVVRQALDAEPRPVTGSGTAPEHPGRAGRTG